jgi:hypothetical protein
MTAFDGEFNRSTQHPLSYRQGFEDSGFPATWLNNNPMLSKHD